MEQEHQSLTKDAGKNAFGTALSRILGYVRDMLVANFFGAGMFADAFYAAFRIPNLFRRLLGEGSFSAAFVPVLSEYLHTKDKSETQKLINVVFTALTFLLIAITVLGIIFSPLLVKIIAWGFTDNPEKMQLTVELTRLMFPFIFFICLAAFLTAVLNTLRSFFIPAFAPSALSVAEIGYMLLVIPFLASESWEIKGLALSVIVGGALHFITQYPKLKSLGWSLKLQLRFNTLQSEEWGVESGDKDKRQILKRACPVRSEYGIQNDKQQQVRHPELVSGSVVSSCRISTPHSSLSTLPFYKHPGIKKIAILMIPAIIGLSVDQINSFIDTICASFLASGSITALYYSNRVMQLPLAIFGLAFASVSLPAMSEARAQNDIATLKSSLNYSIRFTLFTLLPAAVALMVIGLPITRLLFERGRFDLAASLMTNNAMFYYSLGLPAYAMAKIFANAFYAFQDTKTPVKTAVAAMVIHVILCVLLMRPMGVGGLALATAVSSYFNTALLALQLRKRIGKIGLKKIIFSGIKSFIAAAATGAAAWYVCEEIHLRLFISVPSAIIIGIAVFFAVSKILKSEELDVFMQTYYKKDRVKSGE